MEFGILGPLEARDAGRRLPLGGRKQRSLLALLLLHPNNAVSVDRIVDELWGERPPERAPKLVQGHVLGLRKLLGSSRIATHAPGYLIQIEDAELDLLEFERLVAEARAEPDPQQAAHLLRAALALWRGPALADLQLEGAAAREAERLNDLRVAATLDRIDADLELGRHAHVVGELEALVAEHPLQERPRAQLMLALYRSGRQAEALDVYRSTRRLLAEELGLEPSKELERLERLILTQDPELDLPRRPARAKAAPVVEPRPEPGPVPRPPAEPARVRRTVTVVFADCVGWTPLGERLDPEGLHGVLARYSETCADALERHGGAVEKFVGDAVVGVFGLPTLHEDDALRAVRAAVDLRDAVAELSAELERAAGVGIGVKVAVHSGEVFVGPGSRREPFATGDTMNVAARLEQSAGEGQILLGEQTHRLVEHAVVAEELEPLTVKGRTAPVRAWRLLELRPDEAPLLRPATTPFVGRELELAALHAEVERAASRRDCRLCTVVGAAGVGKSRLAGQLITSLGADARVVVGRCLSYGDGITYRPIAEIVRELVGDEPRERLPELLQADDHAELVAERVLGAIGLAEPGGREETFWAVRRLLELAALERPLIAVFEDVHWAEPTLLDLLEYVVGFSSAAPILLLCLARPELLELRPEWAAPQPGRILFALEPLPETDAHELVDSLSVEQLDTETRNRIVDAAEGNPLFLEQLVALRAADETATLPPNVQALLSARIDRLEPAERTVLQYASVEGRNFHRGALEELLPPDQRADVAARLMALVRKQLINPDPPEFPGEDGFRFTHVLTRDAAYSALPKQLRAELHETIARWLETKPKPLAQDEIVGYHLEQAYRYRTEVGLLDAQGRALAAAAADRLGEAARTALLRGDGPAATRLLERAVDLQPSDDPAQSALLPRLGAALFAAGRLDQAGHVLAEAIQRARAAGDECLEAWASVEQELVRLLAESSRGIDAARDVAESATRVLEEYCDDFGLSRARHLQAWIAWTEGQAAAADEAWCLAAEHAERVGGDRELFEILWWRASAAVLGPTPVEEAIRRCEGFRERVDSSPVAVAMTLHPLGALYAMHGDFDTARRLINDANAILDELTGTPWAISHHEAFVERLAGRAGAAEPRLRAACEKLEQMGERAMLATTAATLAQALYARERYEEAEELCRQSEASAAAEDLATHVVSRGVRARILAGRGRTEEAEAVAREALALVARTDWLTQHGDALVDLAFVLDRGGRRGDAEAATRAAVELYERKGNVVAAERALSALAGARPPEAATNAPA